MGILDKLRSNENDKVEIGGQKFKKNNLHQMIYGRDPTKEDSDLISTPYASKKEDAKFKSDYKWLYEPRKGVRWDFNPVRIRDLAQDDAWVQMLVNNIATEIGHTQGQIVENENPEVMKEFTPFERVAKDKTGTKAKADKADEALEMIKNPNPDEDQSDVFIQAMADLLEVGSMCAVKMFSKNDYNGDKLTSNDPSLIHWKTSAPETFTKGFEGKTGILESFYQYDKNSGGRSADTSSSKTGVTEFDKKEIMWSDLHPRSNRRYGLPPTVPVKEFLRLMDLTLEQEQRFWSRGALVAGFIASDGDINEIEALQGEVEESKGKPEKSLMHVEDSEAKYQEIGVNWSDLEMGQRMERYAKVIASEFQVPTSVVGVKPEDVNRATFRAERENFESNTLGPYMQKLERWINDQLIYPHFGRDIRFEFQPGMSETQKASISERVVNEFNSNLITRGEAREQIGYNGIGEEEEDGFKEDLVSERPNLEDTQQLSMSTGKPFGIWDDFEECRISMEDDGYSQEEAKRICGSLQAELKGEETDLPSTCRKCKENDRLVGRMKCVECSKEDDDFEDPCQEGYTMVGTKPNPNGGGVVPACVPDDEVPEAEKGNKKKVEGKQEVSDIDTQPPESVAEEARMALDARDNSKFDNDDCGTRTGWERANQLDNRENLSEDTINRMVSFLNRAEHDSEVDEGEERKEDCGWLMYKAWGGDAGKTWAESKAEEFENARKCNHSHSLKEEEPLRETTEWDKFGVQPQDVEDVKSEIKEDVQELFENLLSDERFKDLIDNFAGEEKNSASLQRLLQDFLKGTALSQGIEETVLEQVGEKAVERLEETSDATGLEVNKDPVLDRIKDRDMSFSNNYSNRIESEIREAVSEGWQEGATTDEIRDNIKEKAEDFSENQSEVIARDQLQRANGEARNGFAQQHSDKFVEEWITAGDDRVRPAHREMNGKWKRPSEDFEVEYEGVGVKKESYPGDSKQGIMCRCDTLLKEIDEVDNSDHKGV